MQGSKSSVITSLVGFALCLLALPRSAESHCVAQLAPALCSEEDGLQKCSKEVDSEGCPTGEFCYPDTDDEGCPLACPSACDTSFQKWCAPVTAPGDACPGNDTCIAKLGPSPLLCPNYCPITCPMGERECDGVRTVDDPCLPEPICVDTSLPCPDQTVNEDGCLIIKAEDGPFTCEGAKEVCPGGFDSEGCDKPKVCKTTLNENLAITADGCTPRCPAACHPGIEQACPVTYDINGCPEEQVCARFNEHCPKNKYQKNNGCPMSASPICDADEKLCDQDEVLKSSLGEGVTDPGATCQLPQKCIKKRLPGHSCDNPCTRDCMVTADDGIGLDSWLKCKGPYDSNGCRSDDTCVPAGGSCPSESYDDKGCEILPSTECLKTEELCDGLYQNDGCQLLDTCIPDDSQCECPVQQYNSEGCLLKTPDPDCPDGKMSCPIKPNDLGCDMGNECVSDTDPGGCATICPKHCDTQGMQECTMTIDPDTSCPLETACSNIMMPEKPHCANLCDLFCDPTAKECLTYDNLGCPKKKCIPAENPCDQFYDSDGCEIVETCIECDEGERECEGGLNSMGCKNPTICFPNDVPCPAPCDTRSEMVCQKGTWDHEPLGEFCVDTTAYSAIWENVSCNTHCPVACNWNEQKACHGGFSAATGCPIQDSCEDKQYSCVQQGGEVVNEVVKS